MLFLGESWIEWKDVQCAPANKTFSESCMLANLRIIHSYQLFIQCFTRAGVILQQLPVATTTAVDPALRGQQAQVLAPPIVHAAQRELTFGGTKSTDKVTFTKLLNSLWQIYNLPVRVWQRACQRRMHNSMRFHLNEIQRNYQRLEAFTVSVCTGANQCSVTRETGWGEDIGRSECSWIQNFRIWVEKA